MNKQIWRPDIMVLGPGGAKGFLELGCLERLFEDIYFLEKVTHWTGVSIGSSIALLIVCGFTIDDIKELCLEVNIIEDIISINLDEAKNNLGLMRNKTVETKLKTNIKKKFGFIPTLKQLYFLTGIVYTAVTFNTDKIRPEFMNKDTEPDLDCVEATLMSMAIPGLIQPRKYKGNLYVDGALGASYPVWFHDDGKNKILGIYISSEQDCYSSYNNPSLFAYRLIQSGMKVNRDLSIRFSSKNVKHIPLKTYIKDTTGLSMTKENKLELIQNGYKCADDFLKINQEPEKYCIDMSEEEEIPFINETLNTLTNSINTFVNLLTDKLNQEQEENINNKNDVLYIPVEDISDSLKDT